ncbi:MAG: GNAT family N-acetyltransferase [Pseudomonadota bacterium]
MGRVRRAEMARMAADGNGGDGDPAAASTAPDGDAASARLVRDISEINAADWDACAGADGPGRPENPFLTHRFLAALEASGSATADTGWAPHHLALEQGGRLLGVAPLYVKSHSQGEFVFDHAWADAFMRAGGRYYPKLQAAAPFTPVTGRRFLARGDLTREAQEAVEAALARAACQITADNGLSSLHITFCTEEEWARLGADTDAEEDAGALLRRRDQQFHWRNDGYASFDAFLETLTAKKRKNLRQERRRAVANDIEIHRLTGDAIEPEHWDAFWRFYQDTGMRKWGAPYLTRAFFDIAQRELREDMLLVMCRRGGRWIAGALNFIGRDALYGRYWGCVEDHPCLHFEACYYQAIDAAIEMGLDRVEAGAQGGHKIARGYAPTATYSLHYIPDPSFRRAVARYLRQERAAVAEEIAYLDTRTPFRKDAPSDCGAAHGAGDAESEASEAPASERDEGPSGARRGGRNSGERP